MRGQAVVSAQFYTRINLLIPVDFIQLCTGGKGAEYHLSVLQLPYSVEIVRCS